MSDRAHTVMYSEQPLYLLYELKWLIREARVHRKMHAQTDGRTVDPRGSQQKQLQGEVTPTITATAKLNHRHITPICPVWQETPRAEKGVQTAWPLHKEISICMSESYRKVQVNVGLILEWGKSISACPLWLETPNSNKWNKLCDLVEESWEITA